ncbi:MAG TPA: hypothetical protein PKD78_12840, partial [Saprospiraceae bacterium]|nr:hypothetical protein [Saprospiraceae bacterium]
MTNQDFDARLKSALENLEVPYEASTWAVLEKRLPLSSLPDDAVDRALRPTLTRLEAPSQHSQWDLLAQRLSEQSRLRRRIWLAKISEAAVFLLLLANLDGWLQGTPQEPVAPSRPNQPIAQHERPAAATSAWKEGGKSASEAGEESPVTHSSAFAYTSAMLASGASRPESLSPLQDYGANGTGVEEAGLPAVLSPWAPSGSPSAAPASPAVSSPVSFVSQESILPLPVAPASPLLGQMPTMPDLWMAASPASGLAAAAPRKAARKSRFYAASFVAMDQNTAHVEGLAPQTSRAYGGGLAAGYRAGGWGVEMGVAYSPKRFRPRKQVEIVSGNINKGYYGVYVQEVSADAVSVPLKATRRLARTGRASLHAVAGVSATIAAEKAYASKTVYYPGFQPQPGTDPLPKP